MATQVQTSFVSECGKSVDAGKALVMKADGWKDAANRHVLGVIISCGEHTHSHEQALPGEPGNVERGYHFDGVASAKTLEAAMLSVGELCGHDVHAVCTDEAGQYGRGKRILSLRFPYVFFGRCYAHLVNCIVKAIFFRSELKEEMDLVTNLIDAFRKSYPWANRLENTMKELYGKVMALIRASDERWTTVQGSFASVLRVRGAISTVAASQYSRDDCPASLKVVYEQGREFWARVESAEAVARPLAQAAAICTSSAGR
eukprot:GHVU01160375.1.p1 GENE.GHVU01160375.1~~GHVU01160375.1.p1  ORF type:complete len:295 (-),score=35.09 GHVU01160375.1:29-805(-)